jgi:hypothetical protein
MSDAAPPLPLNAAIEDDYFDAAMLTVRPRAKTQIQIPEPETNGFEGSLGATLILFIGRDGLVNRIEFEASTLPPDFEAMTRRAFEGALFTPGRINGRAVNVRLPIEVTFDGSAAPH